MREYTTTPEPYREGEETMKKRFVPIALELLGIAVVGFGIGIEVAMHAEVGFILITTGSCLVACGGVLWGKFIRRGL